MSKRFSVELVRRTSGRGGMLTLAAGAALALGCATGEEQNASISPTGRALSSPDIRMFDNMSPRCGAGTVVTGGGFLDSAGNKVLYSVPTADAAGWTADFAFTGSGGEYDEALCLATDAAHPGTFEASVQPLVNTRIIPIGVGDCVSAECPVGTLLTGGGAQFDELTSADDRFIYASFPRNGREWRVCGQVTATATRSYTVRAIARCLRMPNADVQTAWGIDYFSSAKKARASATCPDGYTVSGNGFWVTPISGVVMTESQSFTHSSAAGAAGGPQGAHVEAFAQCLALL